MPLMLTDAGPADWPHLLCLWWRNVRATHGFVDEAYLRAIGAALVGQYLPAMERVRLAVLVTDRPGEGPQAAEHARSPQKTAAGHDGGPSGGLLTRPGRPSLSAPSSVPPSAPAGALDAGSVLAARGTTEAREGLPSPIRKQAGIRPGAQELVPRPAQGRLLAGFLGSVGPRVEMLFVEPGLRGRGIGTALLDDFRARHAEVWLDVNEQNPAARAFYARRGFTVTGRSPLDGAGQPCPLLHLHWAGSRP